jgi:hypothetical protein
VTAFIRGAYPALGRQLLELPGRREEAAVAERYRDQRGQRDAAQQQPQRHELEPDGVDRLGPGHEHADHRAREGDDAGGLGLIDQGDHRRAQAPREQPARSLLRRGSQRQRGLDEAGLPPHLVGETVEGDGRRGHGIADDHAADRHQVARLGREDPEQPVEQAQQSRLPRARRPQDAGRTGPDRQRQPFQDRPPGACERDAVELEEGRGERRRVQTVAGASCG